MQRMSKIFVGLMIILTASTAVFADTITIVADEWCPYNCEPNSTLPGYMIEVAEEALGQAGHKVVYENLDWEKAIKETREGKFSAIVGAAKVDAPGFVFPVKDLGIIQNRFFTRVDSTWTYSGPDSLKNVKIGIIEGYTYADDLDKYFSSNPDSPNIIVAKGDNALEQNIEKLLSGKIDVVVEAGSVFINFFAAKGMISSLDQIRDAGEAGEKDDLYIAFSPANSKSTEYAEFLSKGIDGLRQSGKLTTILQKYGLKDWK
jgi:polar amino acid transport system substrate-binding protein